MASSQLSLFADASHEPAGLRYAAHFISPEEEEALIAHVRTLPLSPFPFGAFEGKRRVLSFGSRYNYTDHKLTGAAPLPDWIQSTIRKVEAFAGLSEGTIRQALVTEYDPGVGIGWHRDKPHHGLVFGLSLGATCRLRLRRKDGAKWRRFTLEVEPRSLYTLGGDARHVWEHSIPPVARTRYSITFRTMAAQASVD